MKCNKVFIMATAAVMIAQNILAQDDMYFTPRKKAQGATAVTSQVVDDDAPYRYRIPADATDEEYVDYGNSDRDVDEYNRRGSSAGDYSQRPVYDDSVTISRQEYEDYAYSRQMERFDDYNGRFTLIVNDPWYYDSWYSPYYDSYYWGTSWYYPWYSSYSWYDPWYRSSYWGWGYGWHRPYYSYYRPYYYRPYYGRTSYRRGGYITNRSTPYGRSSYGYGNRSNSVYRGGSSASRGSARTPQTPSSTRRSTFGNNSSRGGYIGNSSTYGGSSSSTRSSGSFGNSSTTRSSGSFGNSGSFGGGGTRSGGGGFSGGGSRGGGSHGGGRR
jgi:hypothetical protein